jgi:hypothetical protein
VTSVSPLENRLRRGYTAGQNTYQLFPRTVMGEQPNPIGTTALRMTPIAARAPAASALLDCWTLLQHRVVAGGEGLVGLATARVWNQNNS